LNLTVRDYALILTVHRYEQIDADQITTLHCIEESNKKTVGARLQRLFHHGLVKRQRLSQSASRVYTPTTKGDQLLADAGLIAEPKTYTHLRSPHFLPHDLAATDFLLHAELTAGRYDNIRFIHKDEALADALPQIRKRCRWPVQITWKGVTLDTMIEPDKFFAFEFVDKPKGRNRRYFSVEYVRKGELDRSNPYGSCHLKKLVGYAHTYAQNLHQKYLGIPYFYTLSVTAATGRATEIAEKSADQIGSLAPLSAFLSAHEPRRPSLGRFQNVLETQWQTAARKTVTLPS